MQHRRTRKPIPAADQRSWLLLDEVAAAIGCSSATAHRLRRGEIEGVPRLAFRPGRSQEVGRFESNAGTVATRERTDDGGVMVFSDRVEIARQRRTLGVR